MSRGHPNDKLLGVRVPIELFDNFEKFLDTYSSGDTFSDRFRNFISWTVKQEGGISAAKLAVRREQIEKAKEDEICPRGAIMPFHKRDQRAAFCSACRQFHTEQYWICVERRKAKELGEANRL